MRQELSQRTSACGTPQIQAMRFATGLDWSVSAVEKVARKNRTKAIHNIGKQTVQQRCITTSYPPPLMLASPMAIV